MTEICRIRHTLRQKYTGRGRNGTAPSRPMKPRARVLLLASAALSACTVGPDYRPAAPQALGVPDVWSVPAANAQAQDLSHWWRSFDDPLLAELVEQAVVANTDVVQALARLRQAREPGTEPRLAAAQCLRLDRLSAQRESPRRRTQLHAARRHGGRHRRRREQQLHRRTFGQLSGRLVRRGAPHGRGDPRDL